MLQTGGKKKTNQNVSAHDVHDHEDECNDGFRNIFTCTFVPWSSSEAQAQTPACPYVRLGTLLMPDHDNDGDRNPPSGEGGTPSPSLKHGAKGLR